MTTKDITNPGPMPPSQRIHSLDLLRGFVLLGILMVNIFPFGRSYLQSYSSNIQSLSTVDYLVVMIKQVFFMGNFHAIFILLFGAGIYLMTDHVEKRGGKPGRSHFLRMVGLLFFGSFHLIFLLGIDVIFLYGCAGFGVYFFRKFSIKKLVIAIFILHFAVTAINYSQQSHKKISPERIERIIKNQTSSPEKIEKEIREHKEKSWWELIKPGFRTQWMLFPRFRSLTTIFGVMNSMLIGMALFKLGLFSASLPKRFYLKLLFIALPLGLLQPILDWVILSIHQWDPWLMYGGYSASILSQVKHTAALIPRYCRLVGYVSSIMLIYKLGILKSITSRLIPFGRMALTNYLMQSLICGLLFNGYGLGLYGRLGYAELALLALIILVFQVWYSNLWLKYFRFGPMEWLWRSFTYLKFQPLKLNAKH